MKGLIKHLQTDNVAWWSTCVGISLLLLVLSGILVLYRQLPPFLPLYNHQPWGYQRLGKTYEIFVPLTLALLLMVSNTVLGSYLLRKNPLLARFLFVTGTSLAFFVMIFVMRIFQVIL